MRRNAVRAGIIAVGALCGGALEQACSFEHGALTTTNPIDGGIDGPPDAGMCTGATDMCLGDTWRHCSGAGATATDTTCNWGCSTATTINSSHCHAITPTGTGGNPGSGATVQDTLPDSQLADVTLHTGDQIDGDLGKMGMLPTPNLRGNGGPGIINGIDFQHRGPVSVFRFKSLTISGNISLIGSHPIAIVADGDITINGTIDVRGSCTARLAGPGGGSGGSAEGFNGGDPGGGKSIDTNNLGGGGGGNGGSGANGGNGASGTNTGGPAGGVAFGDPQVSVLLGGGGGGGGGGGANSGDGGGGGGAVQFVSNGTISVASGGINAGGCGGQTGSGGNDGGGGGGAGGTIVLEAPKVIIAAALAVNGGGGGAGASGNMGRATNGTLDRTVANGAPSAAGAPGGTGAAGDTAPQVGPNTNGNGGGGGGGIGRIRLNTRSDTGLTVQSSAVLSPQLDDTVNTTCTRGAATTQ